MLDQTRIIIVGMGLMGGSLALALRGRTAHLIAIDNNPETLRQVQAANAADSTHTSLSNHIIRPDDLVILATPVRSIMTLIEQLPTLAPDGCMVIDLGSTKRDICCAMELLPENIEAIGGHPMCGREVSGFSAALGELYQKQTFIMTPTGRTTPRLIALVRELIDAIGSIPIIVPSDKHDHTLAMISHMPHVLSMLLMSGAAEWSDDAIPWHVSASAFAGMTRLAGSDPVMWRDIFITNREAIIAHLQQYRERLDGVVGMLEAADPDRLTDWIGNAQSDYYVYRNEKEAFQNQP